MTPIEFSVLEEHGFKVVGEIRESSATIDLQALQTTLNRMVMVRVLKPEVAITTAARDLFLLNARRIARLKCDGVASVIDTCSRDGLHFVVIEYMEGPSLEELIASSGRLTYSQILRIALELSNTLKQLWESARIIHRNIKSATIKLDQRGIAKIVDFSLIICADDGVNGYLADDNHIVGTPSFLSPEQARGSHELTTQSDMYSLGALCYQMATGQAPFENEDPLNILASHQNREVAPPHQLNPEISAGFSWFVRRLMMKDHRLRYLTWDDVLSDLNLLQRGRAPLSASQDDASNSTIACFQEMAAGDEENVRQRVRFKRKKSGVQELASYRSNTLFDEHATEIRQARQVKESMFWLCLLLWLALLTWYRAVWPPEIAVERLPEETPLHNVAEQQTNDASEQKEDTAQESTLPPIEPISVDTGALGLENGGATLKEELASIPPELSAALATALACNDPQGARSLLAATSARFPEKESIRRVLDEMPDIATLVTEYLQSRIGKPLEVEYNGVTRTVTLRGIEYGTLHLETPTRGIDMPINRLPPAMQLLWMEKPTTPQAVATYCMVLLQTPQRALVRSLAKECPPLSGILTEAVNIGEANPPTR